MKNLKTWSSFNENYPPGAANDPRAPYNQKDPDYETEKFDAFLQDEEENKIPISIEYTYYYEEPESIRKHISDYSYKITGDASTINKDYIEEDVRGLIEENIGDRFYEWEC